jgi:hypothetical protein
LLTVARPPWSRSRSYRWSGEALLAVVTAGPRWVALVPQQAITLAPLVTAALLALGAAIAIAPLGDRGTPRVVAVGLPPSRSRCSECCSAAIAFIQNARRHGEPIDPRFGGMDPFSSAWWFDG